MQEIRSTARPFGRNQNNENEHAPLVDHLCVEILCSCGPRETLQKMFAKKTRNYDLAMQSLVVQRLCGFSLIDSTTREMVTGKRGNMIPGPAATDAGSCYGFVVSPAVCKRTIAQPRWSGTVSES
jgi:hypothetical protein